MLITRTFPSSTLHGNVAQRILGKINDFTPHKIDFNYALVARSTSPGSNRMSHLVHSSNERKISDRLDSMKVSNHAVFSGHGEKKSPLNIGFFVYPKFTGLDLIGPHEILSRVGKPLLIAQKYGEIESDKGLFIRPDVDFRDCPELDIFVVPGGPGSDTAMIDQEVLSFVRKKSEEADTVASVCTGALIVAASGATKGRYVTTHWLARKLLSQLGAKPLSDRVVTDGKYWSSAGVSAGIDLGLKLAAKIAGDDAAKRIQLQVEYDPQPPFNCGNPDIAPAAFVEAARSKSRFPQ